MNSVEEAAAKLPHLNHIAITLIRYARSLDTNGWYELTETNKHKWLNRRDNFVGFTIEPAKPRLWVHVHVGTRIPEDVMKRLPLDIGGEYYGNYGHFAITDYDQLADACVRIRASFDMPRYRRPRRRVRPSHPPCTLTDSYTNAVGKAVVKA